MINHVFSKFTKLISLKFIRLISLMRVLILRLKGVNICWSAEIARSVKISRQGGHIKIGSRSIIDEGAILHAYGGTIVLGADCSVNSYCVLYGHGGLIIGDGVRIATHSIFIPSNHKFEKIDVPIFMQGEASKGIIVEDDVWFGAGVRVLDGVLIGKGCVIGAGSVVTKNTQPFGVYAGVPARLINKRN